MFAEFVRTESFVDDNTPFNGNFGEAEDELEDEEHGGVFLSTSTAAVVSSGEQPSSSSGEQPSISSGGALADGGDGTSAPAAKRRGVF